MNKDLNLKKKAYYIISLEHTHKEDNYYTFSYWFGGYSWYRESVETFSLTQLLRPSYRLLRDNEILVHENAIKNQWCNKEGFYSKNKWVLPINKKTLDILGIDRDSLRGVYNTAIEKIQ